MGSSILNLLNEADWDKPFFKVLANNDTAAAVGHQGGVVIPKDLRPFFPSLDEAATSSSAPTTGRYLKVELFSGSICLGEVSTRYQLQTWGGTRSAESRLTDNLIALRRLAVGDDVLILQRRMDNLDRFRLILIKRKGPDFAAIEKLMTGRKWGALDIARQPITQQAIESVRKDIADAIEKPFEVVLPEVKRVVVTSNRAARDIVFRRMVRGQYSYGCAISGFAIQTPSQVFEIEAAHVVPLPSGGSDDVRNGLALCQTIHWAFDRGLIGIEPNKRTVHVPKQSTSIPGNRFLVDLEGREIKEAASPAFRIHKDALAWHWENLVKKWE